MNMFRGGSKFPGRRGIRSGISRLLKTSEGHIVLFSVFWFTMTFSRGISLLGILIRVIFVKRGILLRKLKSGKGLNLILI